MQFRQKNKLGQEKIYPLSEGEISVGKPMDFIY